MQKPVSYDFFTEAASRLQLADNGVETLTRLLWQEEGVKMPPNVMTHVHDSKHVLDEFFDVIEMVKPLKL